VCTSSEPAAAIETHPNNSLTRRISVLAADNPSRSGITATANYIMSPTRTGMPSLKIIIAAPTTSIVRV
jgi:hypothetical protein